MMEKLLHLLTNHYDVKLVFKNVEGELAHYDDNTKTIYVNETFKENEKEWIAIVFHELGHKYCFDNNIFYHYHYEKNVRLFQLTALKAERYVDRWAKKELKKHGFDIEYPMFYYSKGRTKAFKKYIKNKLWQTT